MQAEIFFRLVVLVVLGCAFLLSGIYRNKSKGLDIIKDPGQEEDRTSQMLQLGTGMAILVILILDLFFPQLMGWSRIEIPLWARILGSILMLVFLVWIWWVYRTLARSIPETASPADSQALITSGPYRWVRHPLYAGVLLLLFSLSLVLEDWLLLVFSVFGTVIFRLLVIPGEEKQLLESFGEEYESYQSRTGALVPWIR